MRLGVTNHWYDKKSAIFWNKDGFLKMLDVLRKDHGWEVKFFKKHEKTFEWAHDYVDLHFSPNPSQALLDWGADAALVFGDFTADSLPELQGKLPIAQCYSGGRYLNHAKIPDIVFVESKTYLEWMKPMGINVTQAFGTNTELFVPMKRPKYWDALFPATGAAWKRHDLFANAMGDKGLVCGWWQPHEPQCLQACLDAGTGVLHHQMPESLVYLYNMARTVVLTSSDVGGSQRTVLEAMACNIPVIAMSDSTMTTEYIREANAGGEIVDPNPESIRRAVDAWKDREVNTRDWILENYSEYSYAKKVKEGIESIMK